MIDISAHACLHVLYKACLCLSSSAHAEHDSFFCVWRFSVPPLSSLALWRSNNKPNLLCCYAFRTHEHTLVWIFLQNVINHFIQTVKDQPFLKTKPIWWGKRWSVHTLYQIQNQTSQGGPNRYIKACVKSNITKAVSDAARFTWIVKSGSWIFVMVNIYCFWMRVWITESRPKWQNNTHILWSDEEQKQLLIYPKTANISYYHCY